MDDYQPVGAGVGVDIDIDIETAVVDFDTDERESRTRHMKSVVLVQGNYLLLSYLKT